MDNRQTLLARVRDYAALVRTIEVLTREGVLLTAEKIYRYFKNERCLDGTALQELRQAFFADDHDLWYQPVPESEGDAARDAAERFEAEALVGEWDASGSDLVVRVEAEPDDEVPGLLRARITVSDAKGDVVYELETARAGGETS